MLRLIIQSDSQLDQSDSQLDSLEGRQFQLKQGEDSSLLIGRGAESAVRLTEQVVSLRHALIAESGGAFYLLDQRSANGTFLNGTRVEEAKLRHGDVIGLGMHGPRLQVVIEGPDAEGIDGPGMMDTSRIDVANTSATRPDASTVRHYAPPTMRLGLNDAARNIGLYNPHFDTGKSKKSSGAGLMWLGFAVVGLMLIGLTILDVGAGNALVGAALAIIPAGFYLAVFLWLDRYDPEPPRTLIFAFVWGAIIAVFVSAIINGITVSAVGDLLTGIVSAPIIEEASKGLGVVIVALFFRKDFDSVVDGIVYAGVVALGFATMENIDYYGRSLSEAGMDGLIGTWLVRGVMSPYSHVLFTCMTGIGCGVARETHNAALKISAPIIGYFSAMFLHALWNRLASFDSGTFFTGYFLLEAPMFCVFLAVIFHLVNREGRILKQSLAVEVERGLITQQQLDIAISVFRRTGWVASAIGNPGIFNARRRFLRAVAKLGLCHWHKQRATEAERDTGSFPLISQFQAEVFSLRNQIERW
ncbi:MAG: PrsW family glutamic-type intramembrane protease [Blastocatellales bacterium]